MTAEPIHIPTPVFGELTRYVRDRRPALLTGAGISTDSGIPDYRGPQGIHRRRTPITYNEFVRDGERRRSYWARSCLGYPFITSRQPNPSHAAVAALQRIGMVGALITQNVDGLHQAAGSRDVVELHGGLDRVVCLACGEVSSRTILQDRMVASNPGWIDRAVEMAPDGDAELPIELAHSFAVPDCDRCGGMLKPDVVFFGESVPRARVDHCLSIVDSARGLLVLGSSLTVYSGFRFAERIVRNGQALLIVTIGSTRADDLATLRIEAPLALVLPRLVELLS